jgi:hypothetical protein
MAWQSIQYSSIHSSIAGHESKKQRRLASGATVAGCVCAVTTSATAWVYGETITDHLKWRRES